MFEFFKEIQPKGLALVYYPDGTIEYALSQYKEVIEKIKNEYIPNHQFDLVEISTTPNCCCPECAKYIGRVYSLTGLDKRFPKFPRWLAQTQCAHCCLEISVCTYGFSNMFYAINIDGDVFEVSNRPFVDDRPQDCIDYYYKLVTDYEEEQCDRKDYACLELELPDAAPKSYSAYRRMKKQKTKGYLKLVEAATEHGIKLPL